MYSNTLDEADIKFYDEFLSSHLDDEGEISRWSNEFNVRIYTFDFENYSFVSAKLGVGFRFGFNTQRPGRHH
jgi:hypothetical protein